jgi:hypothetical protein
VNLASDMLILMFTYRTLNPVCNNDVIMKFLGTEGSEDFQHILQKAPITVFSGRCH